MADIDIQLSQAAYDSALSVDETHGGNLVRNLSAMLADTVAGVQDDSVDISNYVLDDGVFRLEFPDGSYDEFTGVVLADPTALKGTATATGANLYVPEAGLSHQQGLYTFAYDLTGAVPTAVRIAARTDTLTLESLILADALEYDALLGNGTLQVTGAITVDAGGNLGGTVSNLTLAADAVLASASISGAFQVSGTAGGFEDGSSTMTIGGTLTAVDVEFDDGSHGKVGGLAVDLDDTALADPLGLLALDAFQGNDTIRVELPAVLQQAVTITAGAGDDAITVGGGGQLLGVAAGDGSDTISVLSDHHQIDGGAGVDTLVYAGVRADYTVERTDTGLEVGSAGGSDIVANVERVQFSDGLVAYDIDGNAGGAYRLYQAAFDRAPDSAGLGYWIGVLDAQHTLYDVATGFINSDEFADLYGANASDAVFLEKLYENALHRAYDQAGFDYWSGVLASGSSRMGVLVNFSESVENQAQVLDAIAGGIAFEPYVG